ncbi:MAG: hypothetical protein HC830_07095 [Bacteroidetes bacterium]|nr:hypothetical protein [Bacteroidota bacterium]
MGQKKINNIQQIFYFSIVLVLTILGLISIFAILIKNKQAQVFRESSMNEISRSVNLYLEVKQSVLKHTIQDYTFGTKWFPLLKIQIGIGQN